MCGVGPRVTGAWLSICAEVQVVTPKRGCVWLSRALMGGDQRNADMSGGQSQLDLLSVPIAVCQPTKPSSPSTRLLVRNGDDSIVLALPAGTCP